MTMQISATRLPTPILISHSPKQCLVLFELRRAGIDHEPDSAGIRVPFQLPVNGPGAFPFEGSRLSERHSRKSGTLPRNTTCGP